MAKEQQTKEIQKQPKPGKPARPDVAKPRLIRPLTSGSGLLPGGTKSASNMAQIQARLNDRNLPAAQRQALAKEIGRIQGNYRLVQLLRNEHNPPDTAKTNGSPGTEPVNRLEQIKKLPEDQIDGFLAQVPVESLSKDEAGLLLAKSKDVSVTRVNKILAKMSGGVSTSNALTLLIEARWQKLSLTFEQMLTVLGQTQVIGQDEMENLVIAISPNGGLGDPSPKQQIEIIQAVKATPELVMSCLLVISCLLVGKLKWQNPPNDFTKIFLEPQDERTVLLPEDATVNCGDAILYAAYLAGKISADDIRRFLHAYHVPEALYRRDQIGQLDSNIEERFDLHAGKNGIHWKNLGFDKATRYPETQPRPGQLVFYLKKGEPFPVHVGLALEPDPVTKRPRMAHLLGSSYIANVPDRVRVNYIDEVGKGHEIWVADAPWAAKNKPAWLSSELGLTPGKKITANEAMTRLNKLGTLSGLDADDLLTRLDTLTLDVMRAIFQKLPNDQLSPHTIADLLGLPELKIPQKSPKSQKENFNNDQLSLRAILSEPKIPQKSPKSQEENLNSDDFFVKRLPKLNFQMELSDFEQFLNKAALLISDMIPFLPSKVKGNKIPANLLPKLTERLEAIETIDQAAILLKFVENPGINEVSLVFDKMVVKPSNIDEFIRRMRESGVQLRDSTVIK